ncbi:Gastric inhibitory polypeptide [Lemmus lemmus]
MNKIHQQDLVNGMLVQKREKNDRKHKIIQREAQALEQARQSQRNEEREGQQSFLPKNPSDEDVFRDWNIYLHRATGLDGGSKIALLAQVSMTDLAQSRTGLCPLLPQLLLLPWSKVFKRNKPIKS